MGLRYLKRDGETARRLTLLVAALALAALAAGMSSGTPTAQPNPGILEACRPDRETISAPNLPGTVNVENCPVGGRVITDNGVGTILPASGESIYVDALTETGSQELEVTRHRDGTLELGHVGDESEDTGDDSEFAAAAGSPGECSDKAYNDADRRMDSREDRTRSWWYYNLNTTPDELTRKAAVRALRNGGANIANTRSSCRMGDRVPERLTYQGRINKLAQIDASSHCNGNDGESVVSFGRLPGNILAMTCVIMALNGSGYNPVLSSDTKLNKTHVNWTTNPNSRSCRGRYDLEGIMTHERGHTFGLDHVSESSHGKLTMSTRINGPCQSSERSLGRGDVFGLDRKYPADWDS
jgi:hypothetical protein